MRHTSADKLWDPKAFAVATAATACAAAAMSGMDEIDDSSNAGATDFPLFTAGLDLAGGPLASFSLSLDTCFSLEDMMIWQSKRQTPKKRTSHSKKRLRSTHKNLKAVENHYPCPNCGKPKLSHRLCDHCLTY